MRKKGKIVLFIVSALMVAIELPCRAMGYDMTEGVDSISVNALEVCDTVGADKTQIKLINKESDKESIYNYSYSVNLSVPDWHRIWINTAVLSGAFVGSLFVLECLPEDATSWNRDEIRSVPMFKRWFKNVFKRGPEWDHDKFYFNFMLHPYAGATYFMSARSCGFNMWQSLLYCTCISTIGWEFGVEAFMERPSYQDLFITPLVGSMIGEGFYCIKRYIATHGYKLCGSKILGGIVAFIVDPVNEFVGLFAGNKARHINDGKTREATLTPIVNGYVKGISVSAVI